MKQLVRDALFIPAAVILIINLVNSLTVQPRETATHLALSALSSLLAREAGTSYVVVRSTHSGPLLMAICRGHYRRFER